MLDDETIDQQRALLATYRRTLGHLLTQVAQHGGESFTPPLIANGIDEARAQIRGIKDGLRASGVEVDDHPNDMAPSAASEDPSTPAAPDARTGAAAARTIDSRQGITITGGEVRSTGMIGFNEGEANLSRIEYNQAIAPAPSQLEQTLRGVQQAQDAARQRGDDDLADDLGGALLSLQAALKAQREGKAERRGTKLREALEALDSAAVSQPELRELAEMLRQV